MSLAIKFFPRPTLPAAYSQLSMKSAKNFASTHERGVTCFRFTLFIGKTKIGEVIENDTSGSVDIEFHNKESQSLFNDFIKQEDVINHVKSHSESDQVDMEWHVIAIHSALHSIFNYEKEQKKCQLKLIFKLGMSTGIVGWPKTPLAQISAPSIQNAIEDIIKTEAAKSRTPLFVNTPEQLKELGVVFTEVK